MARLAPVGHGWERPVSDSEDRTGADSDSGSGGGGATPTHARTRPHAPAHAHAPAHTRTRANARALLDWWLRRPGGSGPRAAAGVADTARRGLSRPRRKNEERERGQSDSDPTRSKRLGYGWRWHGLQAEGVLRFKPSWAWLLSGTGPG